MATQMTMLELVTAVTRRGGSVDEVVATVVRQVNSDAVRLCGSFRGSHFDVAAIAQIGPLRAAA